MSISATILQAAKAEGFSIKGEVLFGSGFPLGKLIVTSGVVAACDSQGIPLMRAVGRLLMFYRCGIWGDVTEESWNMNNRAVINKAGAILAVYKIGTEKVWVMTELAGEETYTTFFLPGEY